MSRDLRELLENRRSGKDRKIDQGREFLPEERDTSRYCHIPYDKTARERHSVYEINSVQSWHRRFLFAILDRIFQQFHYHPFMAIGFFCQLSA